MNHRVTWPHEVIYSLSALPATDEHLSSIAFVNANPVLTTKLAQRLIQGTVLTMPHTSLCWMYAAIASEPSGGTVTTQRCIVNVREPQKTGHGGGGLTQISPTDTEGFGYNPPNRCVRSIAPQISPPSFVKPCQNAC